MRATARRVWGEAVRKAIFGSGSLMSKMTHKNRKNSETSCLEVLDVLF